MRTFGINALGVWGNDFTAYLTGNLQYLIVGVHCVLEVHGGVVELVLISVFALFQFADALHHRIVQVILEFRYVFIKVCHFL